MEGLLKLKVYLEVQYVMTDNGQLRLPANMSVHEYTCT